VESALEIRRRLLSAYEAAELESDPAQQQAWMTFIIVGGGPTGVELAGAIGELARYTFKDNFRVIDPAKTQVILVESLDRILAAFPADLSAKAQEELGALGVTVLTSSKVTEIAADHVTVQTSEGVRVIPSCTTLWAAGVKASALGQVLHDRTGVELTRRGNVKILPDLTLPNYPEIFVIGDLTYLEQDGKPLPGLAPVAIQQGKHVAKQIHRQLQNKPMLPFHYRDRGIMATIGRAAAVADLYGVHLNGFIAWLAWLVVHIINLIGFRNRLEVLSEWVWNYLSYARTVRLIIRQEPPGAQPPPVTTAPAKQFQAQPRGSNGENGKDHERSQQAQGRAT
jgi:NADH dehydrogenase